MNDQKINTTLLLHNKSVNLVNLAQIVRENINTPKNAFEYRELLMGALELEEKAANAVQHEEGSEPTRSILYRSAASLAYLLGDHQKALQLTRSGLDGWPTPQVESKLKELKALAIKEYYRTVGVSYLQAINPISAAAKK